jgi:hypothetical protein
MTQHVAYKWHGDYYCGDDIVSVLTEHQPWSAWCDAGGEVGEYPTEIELDDIAIMFRIDRSDPQDVLVRDFPVLQPDGHPGFCARCRRWFDDDDD